MLSANKKQIDRNYFLNIKDHDNLTKFIFCDLKTNSLIIYVDKADNKDYKIETEIFDNCPANIFLISTNCGNLKLDININVKKNSKINFYSFIENQNNNLKDINIVVDHVDSFGYSELNNICVNYDKSHTKFVMRTIINKESKNCSVYQQVKFLQDGALSKCEGLPILDIFNNQVIAAKHSCTIGKIDEDFLLYCQTKGINEIKAKNLIMASYVNDIFTNLPKEFNYLIKGLKLNNWENKHNE